LSGYRTTAWGIGSTLWTAGKARENQRQKKGGGKETANLRPRPNKATSQKKKPPKQNWKQRADGGTQGGTPKRGLKNGKLTDDHSWVPERGGSTHIAKKKGATREPFREVSKKPGGKREDFDAKEISCWDNPAGYAG